MNVFSWVILVLLMSSLGGLRCLRVRFMVCLVRLLSRMLLMMVLYVMLWDCMMLVVFFRLLFGAVFLIGVVCVGWVCFVFEVRVVNVLFNVMKGIRFDGLYPWVDVWIVFG